MDELIIPAAPHWYKANILACASDNTFLYGAKNDLTIIKDDGKIFVLTGPVSYITSIGINKKWNDPNKYCVVLYECGILKVWDIETLTEKYSVDLRVESRDLIGAVFAGEDRVVTVSTSGVVTIWNFITNELNVIKHLFPPKSTITCLSACPYSPWLVAFGLFKGMIFVCDLRRKGSVRFKLRGHDKSVNSLVWCPVPINIFPKSPNNKVKQYPIETNLEIEKNHKVDKESVWTNLKYADDVDSNKTGESTLSTDKQTCDFVQECQDLKTRILGIETDNKSDSIVQENFIEIPDVLEADEIKFHDIGDRNFDILEEKSDRPLPNLYDPSGDFFDEIHHTNDEETNEIINVDILGMSVKTLLETLGETGGIINEEVGETLQTTDEIIEKDESETPEKTDGIINEEVGETLERTDEIIEKDESETPEKTDEIIEEVETLETDEIIEKDESETPEKTDGIIIEEVGETLETDEIIEKDESETPEKTDGIINEEVGETLETDEIIDESETPEKTDELTNDKEVSDTLEKADGIINEISEALKKFNKIIYKKKIEKTLNKTGEKNIETVQQLKETDGAKDADVGVLLEKTHEVIDVQNVETVEHLEKTDDVKDEGVVLEKTDAKDLNVETVEQNVEVLEKNIVEVEEEPRDEYLLASTGNDKNIYIWRVGTDGRMQTFFTVPKKKYKTKNTWIVACWATPTILITTSLDEEILIWDLTKLKQYSVAHKEHQGIVYNIVAPIKYLTKENWSEKIDLQIWSQNGYEIINYNVTNNETKLFYSTITAFVSVLQLSPLDPNRLAVGMRDGYIKIWDLSSTNLKSIKLKTIRRIQNKVTSLCWHPIKENILAYGGEDGQIGFVDVLTQKTTKFRYSLHNPIYHIEYGPYNQTDQLCLYAVGENRIFVYNADKPNNNPEQLELSEKLIAHRFSWKPDFRLLLISLRDGTLQVFDRQLELLTKLYFNEKGLNSIVWHPNSARSNWFAAATSKGFFIYDCGKLLDNPNGTNLIENKIVDVDGHLKPVTNLCWSPFKNDQLLSSSTDGLTHVWDIKNKIITATFVDPYSKQICTPICWSPLDENLVILGNRVITVWNINNYPPKCDEEFMAKRKKLLKIESGVNKPELEAAYKPKKTPKNCIVPTLYTSNDENLGHQVSNMRKLLERTLNQQNDNDIFELFGNRDDVMNLLTRNYELHIKESKLQYCDLISLWKGDISERIKSAIEENRVTPSIIMLAPMASPKLWQDACESYANKLAEFKDSDPLEIAKFYLACHKIEEAIDILCLAHLYREALALAKCRFPENSETVRKVTEKWAKHAVVNGNFEAAAYCYLSLGNIEEAAQVLARRNNVEFLEFAKELAIKCDNQDLCDSIKFKCEEIAKNRKPDEKLLPTRIEIELKNPAEENSSLQFRDVEESQE